LVGDVSCTSDGVGYIRYSVAEQESISGATGTTHRILGANNGGAALAGNYAVSNLTPYGAVGHDQQDGANLTDDVKRQAAYTNGRQWEFATIWAIREQKSYPYLRHQSAPAMVLEMAFDEAKLDMINIGDIDSIVVSNGATRSKVATVKDKDIKTKKAVDRYVFFPECTSATGIDVGDTLYFVVYEKGKAASYPESGIVKPFYGAGTDTNPYQIWKRADLERLKDYLGGGNEGIHYRLMTDIDLGACGAWTPIGNNTDPFRGKLHGNGHKLTNITVNGNLLHAGLFGALGEGAFMDSLHIVGGSIVGGAATQYAGALAGSAVGAITINACSNTATVKTVKTDAYTGGLIGQSTGTVDINYAHNSGWIRGAGAHTGGLVGDGAGAITNSYNSGWIFASGAVGGLAGQLSGDLDKSYATGMVKANSSGVVGGLIGNGSGSTITYSVAAQDSLIGAATTTHRIVGANAGILTNNYASAELKVNGAPVSGGTAGDVSGLDKTLAELKQQSAYSTLTWDFADWTIRDNEKSMPYLPYQSAPVFINYLYRDSVSLDIPTGTDSVVVYRCQEATGLKRLQALQASSGVSAYLLAAGVKIDSTLVFVAYTKGYTPSYPVYSTVTRRKITIGASVTEQHKQIITYGDEPVLEPHITDGATSAGHVPDGKLALTLNNITVTDISTSGHYKVGRYGFNLSAVTITDPGGVDFTDDYDITIEKNDSLIINRLKLVHNIAAEDTTYNGSVEAKYSGGFTNIVTDAAGTNIDDVALVSTFALEFDDPNAGIDKPVHVVADGWEITGVDASNYILNPEPADLKATIKRKKLDNVKIVLDNAPLTYTGAPIEPSLTATYPEGGSDVEIPSDAYSIAYQDNTNAGTASVRIEGKEDGNYEFSADATFTIDKATLTLTLQPGVGIYNMGNPVLIDPATVEGNVDGSVFHIIYHYETEDGATVDYPRELGIYYVFAIIQETANYESAVSNTVMFEVIVMPPKIDKLFVNEEEIPLTRLYADLLCGSEARIRVEAPEYVRISFKVTEYGGYVDGEPGRATIVQVTEPGMRLIYIKVVSGLRDTTYILKLEKRFDFNELVVTRWNNTLTILPALGARNFTAYQLYRKSAGGNVFEVLLSDGGGAPSDVVFAAFNRSYTVNNDGTPLNPDDAYYAAVVCGNDTLHTCEHYPGLNPATIRIYPNPALHGTPLTLETDVDQEWLNKAEALMYNATGNLLSRTAITGNITTLQAPDTPGIYLVVFQTKDGFRKELKVIVQ
jgi:hypothetical protein